jgi:diguanylate cyclase (GGDEF)-like protein
VTVAVPTLTPTDGPEAPRSAAARAALILLLALGYLATALGGLAISRQAGNIATLWPPNGVLVAVLLLSRRDRWIDVLVAGAIGSIAANLLNDNTVIAATSITIANLVEAVLAASLIRKWTGHRVLFQRSSDVVVLTGVSIFSALVAGALSAASAWLLSDAPFLSIFIRWVLGDVLGLLIVMPIVAIAYDLYKHGPDLMLSQRSALEAGLLLAMVFVVGLAVFSPDVPNVQFLVIPVVLLASFRLGPLGAALSTVIIAIVGSIGTVQTENIGAIPADSVTLHVFRFQLYLAVLFLSALPIGSAMAQRARLERDLKDEKDRADRFAGEMAELASIDDLTGLANRRHFLEHLHLRIADAQRTGHPVTLAIFDIDHFKPINDQYGHAAGDAVLRAIGAACKTAVRTEDLIGRIGGEEFAMIMPATDPDAAFGIVDRLREAVAATVIPAGDGRLVSVTISVGIALFADQPIDGLLIEADRALYVAKAQGRNQIRIADRPVHATSF